MGEREKQKRKSLNLFGFIRRMAGVGRRGRPSADVYFISGMCYNCKVFDRLRLPRGFKKIYLEWHLPRPDESLQEYAKEMAGGINTKRPFVLVGYSFGAVVMQEMGKFLKPDKSVIISSFKDKDEIPSLFQAVKKSRIAEKLSMKFYSSTEFITSAFNKLVYDSSNEELAEYMTHTDPVYIKWAIVQITDWVPGNEGGNLFHIHGTDDQIFPHERLHKVFSIEGGDHLMVLKKADEVSYILDSILLMRD